MWVVRGGGNAFASLSMAQNVGFFYQAVDPKRMHGYDIGLSVAGRSMGLNQ